MVAADVLTLDAVESCSTCQEDRSFLLLKERPAYEDIPNPVRVVDLFCGCGGLSLGIAEAARRVGRGVDVALAADHDEEAVEVFRANFPKASVRRTSVETILGGELGARKTRTEKLLLDELGPIDVLVGGPPCQGYSDLNNHTRRSDSRNALYSRMARGAWLLQPRMVLIENVATIRHDAGGLAKALSWLGRAGYVVHQDVLDLSRLGVPQRRRRHIVLAFRHDVGLDPEVILTSLQARCDGHLRHVRWAMADLEDVEVGGVLDSASIPTPTNAARIKWLFDKDKYNLDNDQRPTCHQSRHSYVSMYGRLKWDEPAQTVTTGFGSMGQGRYVHPSRHRTITPHEAARLQMLPDFFDFSAARTRSAIARMIGNSVPPILGTTIGSKVLDELLRSAPLRKSATRR